MTDSTRTTVEEALQRWESSAMAQPSGALDLADALYGVRERAHAEEVDEALAKLHCADKWMDRGEPVCGRHGFLWEDGNRHCNSVDPEVVALLTVVTALRQPADTTAAHEGGEQA